MALDGPCSTTLSPYQEVASGSNNEKYNADYGVGIPAILSSAPSVAINKTGDTTVSEPGTITYNIPLVNSGTADAGLSFSSALGTGLPLVISDTIPAGLVYVSPSASLSGDVTAKILYYNTSNSTWESTEPPAADVGAIQWWLDDPLPANGGAVTATFQAAVPSGYAAGGGATFIENDACASFGTGISFACDDTVTVLEGTGSIGDYVWQDENSDGIQDVGESGINGVTVSLYWDRNGDGEIDAGDLLIDTQDTVGDGAYNFADLPPGDYLVAVDFADVEAQLPGYNYTTPEVDAVALGDGDNYDDADFGFGPILDLTKVLINGDDSTGGLDDIYEGQIATYRIEASNNRPGGIGADNSCFVQSWTTDIADGSNGGTPWASPSSLRYAPDGAYATSPLLGALEAFDASGYSVNLVGNPTAVEIILEVNKIPLADGTLSVSLNGGAVWIDIDMVTELTNGEFIVDITDFNGVGVPWTAAQLNALVITIDSKKAGNPSGDLQIDALGIQVTTDETCDDAAYTLNPVPVVDTYDPTELEFISSNPPVSAQSSGVLTWTNVGPLAAGETAVIEVNFKPLAPVSDGDVITNTATTDEAKYQDGRDANDADDDEPAEVYTAYSIGDFVWFDANNNATQDDGANSGLAGVVVELYVASTDDIFYNGQIIEGTNSGVLIITTTTDANGAYLFEGLPAGADYEVRIDASSPILSGLNATTFTDGIFGDDNNVAENSIDPLTADVDTADFGFESNSMIYGKVWHDANADADDTGENDIAGVTVELYDSTGTTLLQTTTTDENGLYQFANVTDATYTVVVTPPGTQVSEPNGADTTQVCGTCNNQTSVVVSGAGIYGAYDFGYTGADIGDTLFVDWNGDGDQDTGEEGIPDVDVRLYSDVNGNGEVDAEDTLLETDTTDGSGQYLFTNYPAGNYLVIVDTGDADFPLTYTQTADPDSSLDNQHAATTDGAIDLLTVDFGYQPQGTASIGDFVWADTDKDGIQDSGEAGIDGISVTLYQDQNGNGMIDAEDAVVSTTVTAGGGLYDFPNLAAGNYIVDVDTADTDLPTDGNNDPYILSTNNDPLAVSLSVGEDYDDADFGFAPSGVIGDYIWSDNNGDGIQDIDEPVLAGVTVTLTLSTGATIVTTTNSSGLYEFNGLPSGTYTVTVDVPAGYTQTGDPDATGPCTTDPNNDCDSTSVVTLSPGQVNRSRDFGYKPASVIGDFIWLDQNGDGVQDAGEPGLPNVVITLTLQGGTVFTTTTDSDGYYTFAGNGGIPAGDHTVEVDTSTLPSGLTGTFDADSPLNASDDTATLTTDGSSDELGFDFGYQYTGTFGISGVVFEDTSLSGSTVDAQADELTYENIPVYLWYDTGGGNYTLISTTISDGANGYSFSNLPAGDYVVSISDQAPELAGATYRTFDSGIYGANVQNSGQAYENVATATAGSDGGSDANVVENVDFGFSGGSPTAITLYDIATSSQSSQVVLWILFMSMVVVTTIVLGKRKSGLK